MWRSILVAMGISTAAPATAQPSVVDGGVPETATIASASDEPELSAGRVTGEVFAGLATAIGGLIAGSLVGYFVSDHRGDGAHDLNNTIYGGGIGYVATVPLGVYLAGRVGDQTCSGTGTVLGGIIGIAPGIVVGALESGSNDGVLEGVAVVGVLAGSVAGSVIGCNLGRQYKSPPPHLELGIPMINRGHVTTVPLFTATF